MKLSSSIVLTPSWSSSRIRPPTVSRAPSSRDRGRDKSPTSSHPYQTPYPPSISSLSF
ncbi:hypothetical protein Syun_017446 [Stephania yunnanensis]|uniref:Uncharacterized protein n=1 Tax=Stephania yunnanensis TaxID=152371 RepID=A0AAP0P3D6_9MAGN